LVYIVEINGSKYYACSICRSLFVSEDMAKACEEYCSKNPGSKSPESTRDSIGFINPEGEPQKVYFKVAPLKGCTKTVFRLCRAGVNIYSSC